MAELHIQLQKGIKYISFVISVALGISFLMVLESPQSESRFKSYGQNSKTGKIMTECDSHPVLSFSGYIKYPVRSAPPSAIRTRQESRLFRRQMDYSCHQSVYLGATRTHGCDPQRIKSVAQICTTRHRNSSATRTHGCDSHSRVRLAPEPRCF